MTDTPQPQGPHASPQPLSDDELFRIKDLMRDKSVKHPYVRRLLATIDALQRQRDAVLALCDDAEGSVEFMPVFIAKIRKAYADAALASQPGVQAVTDAEVERLQEIERRTKSLQTMICEQHQVWPHGPEGLFSFILTGAAVRAEAGR